MPHRARRAATLALLAVVLSTGLGCARLRGSAPTEAPPRQLERLVAPPGFEVQTWAEVPGARSLAVDPSSDTVYVGTRGSAVYAVRDADGDGLAETVLPLRDDLDVPNGVAWDGDGGRLVIVEHDTVRLVPAPGVEKIGQLPEPVFHGFPKPDQHGWRFADIGPDGRLYVGVGAPCNLCEGEGYEGTIVSMTLEGTDVQVFGSGIRNTVGFDWQPTSGVLWFTDNGTDGLGDDVPSDELNAAPRAGLDFGFPHVWGVDERPYPGWEDRPSPQITEPAEAEFTAHSAPLGLHFLESGLIPEDWVGDAIVALHGSWNRDPDDPSGYALIRARFDEQGILVGEEPFVTGFLDASKKAWGRPVDIAQLHDGSILVSDDLAGAIYRITYGGSSASAAGG